VGEGCSDCEEHEEETELGRDTENSESIPGSGAVSSLAVVVVDDDVMADVTRYVPVVGDSCARNVPHLTSSIKPPPLVTPPPP
jgi:hypothetical protein